MKMKWLKKFFKIGRFNKKQNKADKEKIWYKNVIHIFNPITLMVFPDSENLI